MKYGEVWQVAIGNFDEFCDLGIGHETGLDVISESRKIIIELKNRYNTDNSSSRKANNDKLAKFKCLNPDWTCIYGVINENSSEGKIKEYEHNGQILHYYSGTKLFELVFGDKYMQIVDMVKFEVAKYKK